jgi:hypothetical protein
MVEPRPQQDMSKLGVLSRIEKTSKSVHGMKSGQNQMFHLSSDESDKSFFNLDQGKES